MQKQFDISSQLEVLSSKKITACKNRKGLRKESGDLLEQFYIDLVIATKTNLTIEIGAHEASFSKEIKQQSPASNCFAFEANPYVYKKHHKEIKSLGVNYLQQAISDTTGRLLLSIPIKRKGNVINKDNPISSLVKRNQPGFEYESVEIDSIRLDEYFSDISQKRTALWIDVEGSQEKVLSSAKRIWERVHLVYIEVEKEKVWRGQKVSSDIDKWFLKNNFTEIMRDNLAKGQYNTVYIRSDFLMEPVTEKIINDYENNLKKLIEI